MIKCSRVKNEYNSVEQLVIAVGCLCKNRWFYFYDWFNIFEVFHTEMFEVHADCILHK